MSRPVDRRLFVVFRPTADYDGPVERLSSLTGVDCTTGHLRQELRRVSGLPVALHPLVKDLESVFIGRASHQHFEMFTPSSSGAVHGARPASGIEDHCPNLQAFAATADGKILSGRYSRSERSEGWLVPTEVTDLDAWVHAAMGEWHRWDPGSFPDNPGWELASEWATAAERETLNEIALVESARSRVLNELRERDRAARGRLAQLRATADAYERLLLTGTGDELVDAVAAALGELGFQVENMDHAGNRSEKLEDLRVRDPSTPGWAAIAEVKGYDNGGRTRDLQQLARFAGRYRQETGAMPAAQWYIVNHHRKADPATRPKLLYQNDDDIDVFAEDGGLIVDTVEIFRALLAVRANPENLPICRTRLRESVRRLCTTQDTP